MLEKEGLKKAQTQIKSEGVAEETQKLYTVDELNTMLQSEADRRVTSALQKAEQKWEERTNSLLSKKEKEIEQSKLSEEGRFKELFEQKQAELDSFKASAERERVRAETNQLLAKKNLGDLSDFFNKDLNDFENRKEAIENLDKHIENIVSDRVSQRLVAKPPAKGAKDDPSQKSLEDRERAAIKNKKFDELRRINIEKLELLSGKNK